MSDLNFYHFQSCCRLCLTDKLGNSKSIFDATVEDCALQQKILQYLAIEIYAEDILSTVVCSQCIIKLIGFHSYKERCEQNQSKLEKWLTGSFQTFSMNGMANISLHIKEEPMGDEDFTDSSEAPENYIETINESMDHINEPKEMEDNDLPSASTAPLDPEQLQNCSTDGKDISKYQLGSESLTAEDFNQQKIQSISRLKLMPNNSTPVSGEVVSEIELSYIDECKDVASKHQTLSASNVQDNSEGIIRLQDDNKMLPNHVVAEEDEESDVILIENRKSTTSITETDKKKDKVMITKSTKVKCYICPKEYSSLHNMRRHYKLHVAKKLNMIKDKQELPSSPDCGGIVNISGSDDEPMLPCELCDVVLSTKEEFNDHKLYHEKSSEASAESYTSTELKMRKCEHCKKKFVTATGLWNHKTRFHPERNTASPISDNEIPITTNEGMATRPSVITCDVCVRTFKSEWAFKIHMKKHIDGDKLTKQKYCDILFDSSVSLMKHTLKEHNGCKTGISEPKAETEGYACSICAKSFPLAKALSSHKGWHRRSGNNMKTLKKNTVTANLNHSEELVQESIHKHPMCYLFSRIAQ